MCLAGGTFVGDGEPAAVLANPAVREVFLGTDVTAALAGSTLSVSVGQAAPRPSPTGASRDRRGRLRDRIQPGRRCWKSAT